jgi:8-oxo-dGTP pyrophosphatase MutT (NUDIX family)
VSEPVRDAATLILVRRRKDGPSVLMGQRGRDASFMPDKFVFPGGAVDPVDATVGLGTPLAHDTAARLARANEGPSPEALAAAAIRELWEEAGLLLGAPAPWPDPPKGWRGFAATGHRPAGHALRFVFRAITPPGRTRRFDARFFLADSDAIVGDPDDFSRAEAELGHLQWVPLAEVRRLDLPFVTEVVLAEVGAHMRGEAAEGVPFFENTGPSRFLRL